jgi:uncharacterized protein YuzE
MKITYDKEDDILHIEFFATQVIRDVSHGKDISIGFDQNGIAEITILNAKAGGYWTLENLGEQFYQS